MDNIYKVIIMAGQVMLFLVALSTGIYLYGVLMDTEEKILVTSSDSYSRRSEKSTVMQDDYLRTIYPSEVIWSVLSMLGSKETTEVGQDFVAKTIKVYYPPSSDSVTFTRGGSNLSEINKNKNKIKTWDLKNDLKKKFGSDTKYVYTVSYSFDSNDEVTIVYKWKTK